MSTDKEFDDGLTDEERAALAEDDGENTDEGAGDDQDDAQAGDDGADGDAGDGNDANAGEDAAEAADDTQQAGDDAAAAAEPAAAPQQSAPVLIAQPLEDAQAKLADIATKKTDLVTRFDDGDITTKEYQQELDALNKAEREIEFAIHETKLAEKMEQQRLQNEWTATVNAFIGANDRYDPVKNPRMYQMLDMEVRAVAGTEEAKAMTGAQILRKAHENLAEAFGFADDQKQAPAAGRKPIPRPALPPSLDKVPAADTPDMSQGRFAGLDRLAQTNPIAYEEALMKLSDSEREAYLAA